jgi:hypothetical protein
VLRRIDRWGLVLSLSASAAIVWQVALTRGARVDRTTVCKRLFAPAAGVLLFLDVLYVLRLIPPVPLSV